MPGYYVHLAASNHLTLKNRSFVCGVELPDLLKEYYKSYGLDGARKKYNIIKTSDMPDFSYFELRVRQIESKKNKNGLHYGLSSNPDIMSFWSSLTLEQKKNPFYIGYLWHLLTDLLVYKCLDIETKLEENIQNNSKNNLELKHEIDRIHDDWDKINTIIRDEYLDIQLTREILELGIVKFIDYNHFNYIDYYTIKYLIDYLRKYNPLDENVDDILANIINTLPNLCEETKKYNMDKKRV